VFSKDIKTNASVME